MKPGTWARSPIALLAIATSCVVVADARAQSDRRDVITRKEGEPLRGRVFSRYEPDAITLQVDGKRSPVPLADVVAIDTVRDRVREFFARLDRLPGNLKHRWFLAHWAADRELHDLARLTALDVVLREPDHEGAHTLLGHRRRDGQWLWPVDDGWKTFAELRALRAEWKDAWVVEGEHFRVKSDADLRRVVDAVWDLERFHLAWFDRFGEAMRLYEVAGDKLHVSIRRDEREFDGMRNVPGQVTAKNPYFKPGASELPPRDALKPGWPVDREPSISHTYFADPNATKPLRMFEVVTSHLLHYTVADNPEYRFTYRPAPWAELGLARVLDRSFTGPAGEAVLGAWRIDPADARTVLAQAERDLAWVTRYDNKKLWGGVSDENLFAWPAAELAVAWLLEAGKASGLRNGFFRYTVDVRRPLKVSSSAELDRQLGQPVEKLDAPWRAWIREQLEAATKSGSPQPPVR